MQSFTAIHSNTQGPVFATFGTIQEAKTYLQNLIRANRIGPADTMAIIRTSDDSIVYFKKKNNSVASLNAAFGSPDIAYGQLSHSVLDIARERLTLAFSALTSAMSRR